MTTIVYTRSSKGDSLALDRQREDCRALAHARGWSIAAELGDDDRSAAGRAARPDFERLLGMVERGQARTVVAWSLDRLTRNRRDTLRLIETCREHGVTIALVRGSDLDLSTPSGRLVADVLAATAQAEIDVKGDRERRAVAQAVAQGRRRGGRRPFGFELDMTHRADEAEAVRWAYRELLAGASLGSIAREWNARGLSTPQERWKHGGVTAWTAQAVGRALRKPTNAGLRAHKGQEAGPATWAGLVDESTWRAAQAVLSDPGRLSHKGGPRRLLTGLARCGVCGQPVHAGGGRASLGYATYRCPSMAHISRRAEPIEGYVSALVVARLSRPDAAALLRSAVRTDTAPLHEQVTTLRARIDGLADDVSLSERVMARRVAALEAELRDVEAKLADAGRVDLLGELAGVDDVANRWERMNLDRRRAVVALLVSVEIPPVGRGVRLPTFDPTDDAAVRRIGNSLRVEWI